MAHKGIELSFSEEIGGRTRQNTLILPLKKKKNLLKENLYYTLRANFTKNLIQ